MNSDFILLIVAIVLVVCVAVWIGVESLPPNPTDYPDGLEATLKIGTPVQIVGTQVTGTITDTDRLFGSLYLDILVDTDSPAKQKPIVRVDAKYVTLIGKEKNAATQPAKK